MAEKVRAGQPLSIAANDWNSICDILKLSNDSEPGQRRSPFRFVGVLVKNTTSDLMGIGCPVKLGALTIGSVPEIAAGIDDSGFYDGTFPTEVLTLPACGVCTEPIGAGLFGIVAIAGTFWAKVNGSVAGNYIDTLPSSDGNHKTSWRYSDSGPHRVLGRTTGGAKIALNQSSWNIIAKTPVGGIAANGSATCTLQLVNPTTGAITATTFTKTIRNMTSSALAAEGNVQAKPIGDHYFVDVGSCA